MRGRLCLRKKWSHSKGLLLYIFKIGKNESTFVFPMEMFHQVEGGREKERRAGAEGKTHRWGADPEKASRQGSAKPRCGPLMGETFFPPRPEGVGSGWTCSQPSFQCVDLEMPVLTLTTALSPSTIQHQSYASQTETCAHLSTV